MIYELNRFLPNVLLLPVMIIRQVWFRSYNLQHAQGVSITQHYSVFSRVHCRPHTWWHYPLVTLWPAMNIVTSQAQRLNSQSNFFSCGNMRYYPKRNLVTKKNSQYCSQSNQVILGPFLFKTFSNILLFSISECWHWR